MDPREFLRLLLKRDRTNPTALARTLKTLGRTNVNLQSHISRWLGDPSHSLAITTAEPIAEHLEIDLAALYKPAVARAEAWSTRAASRRRRIASSSWPSSCNAVACFCSSAD